MVTHSLSNYVPIREVTSCSQPFNCQPNTAANFNALYMGSWLSVHMLHALQECNSKL